MGPVERAVVAVVAGCVWPGNAVSRRLGRAAVLAARAVDGGEGYWPYAGTRREVLERIVCELQDCGQASSVLDELRAARVCRPVLGCPPQRRREHGCDERGTCSCGQSVPGSPGEG